MSRIIAEIRRFKVSLTELWMDSQLTYIFFKRVRFSRNFVSSSWCEREGPSKSDENGDSKNYASLYATISRRLKVVSKRMKKRFKGEDFALPMIVRSSIGSRSLRSYNGLKFFFFLSIDRFIISDSRNRLLLIFEQRWSNTFCVYIFRKIRMARLGQFHGESHHAQLEGISICNRLSIIYRNKCPFCLTRRYALYSS